MEMVAGIAALGTIALLLLWIYLLIKSPKGKDMRYKYTIPLMGVALAAASYGVFTEQYLYFIVTASLFSFLIGFLIALDKMHKHLYGEGIDDDTMDRVLDQIL